MLDGAVSLKRPKRRCEDMLTDYTKCVICQEPAIKQLLNIQLTTAPKLIGAMTCRRDETYRRLHHDGWKRPTDSCTRTRGWQRSHPSGMPNAETCTSMKRATDSQRRAIQEQVARCWPSQSAIPQPKHPSFQAGTAQQHLMPRVNVSYVTKGG